MGEIMELVFLWFRNNLDIVFLVYGLAFVIMGTAISVQSRQESEFKLANILWLFVAYALIHAPADFLDMRAVTKGRNETLYELGQILTYTSYFFVFEFGRRLLGFTKKVFAWWILPIIALGVMIVSIFSGSFWVTANILIGYFVRFPAGVMSGLGFIWHYRSQRQALEFLKVKKYFYWAGAALLVWAFFCGIVREKGVFLPACWLNTSSFLLAVGIPVHIFRTLCALILVWATLGILRVFDWESKTKLKNMVEELQTNSEELQASGEELKTANEELQTSNEELATTNEELRTTTEELQKEKGFAKVIAENIQEGIMLLSKDFKILWANKKIMDLTGLKEEDVLGGYCYKVTHRRDKPCEAPYDICPLHEVLEKDKPVAVVHTHFDKEGNKFYAEVSVYPAKNEKGEVMQFIHVARDITEKVKLEEELKKKMENLERFNKLSVGRELKMKEMKARIAELEGEIRSLKNQ